MSKVRGQAGLIAVAVVIALLIVRCGGGSGDDAGTSVDTTAVQPAEGYLGSDGPVVAMAAFQEELGDRLKIREAAFYEDYVIVEAQDPAKPQNIDRYTLRDGDIGEPEPVHLSSSDIVEVQVFRVADVDWAVVAEVANAAPERLRIEEGRPTYAYVERNHEREIRIHVSVDSPRRSGYVEADLEGTILQATLS